MASDRCSSCAAVVRPGADWCTLCYADLRPAPAPVDRVAYPRPSTAPTYQPTTSTPAFAPGTDALHAPYEHVLAAVYGGDAPATVVGGAPAAAPPPPPKPVGWPCTKCGEFNSFERATCSICLAPFGAALRTREMQVDRKRMMLIAVGGAITFLTVVAALTFALTKPPPASEPTRPTVPTEQVDDVVEEEAPVLPQAPVVPPVASQPAIPGQPEPGQSVPGQPEVPAPTMISGEVVVPGQNLLETQSPTPVP